MMIWLSISYGDAWILHSRDWRIIPYSHSPHDSYVFGLAVK